MACRYDVDCSMVSANNCDNETDGYQICGKTSGLIASDQGCTYRKIGSWLIENQDKYREDTCAGVLIFT